MARLLRNQGYTATGLAQVLAESGVSNGSLYHHFPGGLEELAEVALATSGQAVADVLSQVLDDAPDTATGIARFLDIAARPDDCEPGCPIAPTALESPMISAALRATATRCFAEWERLIAKRLQQDGWTEEVADPAASATLSLVEGALLLARVSGDVGHLASAKKAVAALLLNQKARDGVDEPQEARRARSVPRRPDSAGTH
jgi:TetR/AcrR family transcriptional regulator, lmrAB and yxaGH operons repressor